MLVNDKVYFQSGSFYMAMKYTDQMIAELQSIGTFDYEECKQFANRNPSVTARSVMAKVKALGLVYNTKSPSKATKELKKLVWGEEIPF